VTIKNLSKTKDLEFLPVYVNDKGDEEPEKVDLVDLKCGGEVCVCERESVRVHGREREREGGNVGREGGKEGGRQTD
jgi:hypothetical protein